MADKKDKKQKPKEQASTSRIIIDGDNKKNPPKKER